MLYEVITQEYGQCHLPDVPARPDDRLSRAVGAVRKLPSPVITSYSLHDTKLYDPNYLERAAARASLGLPSDSILLLAFGSIRRYKGADRLVRALPEIRTRTGRDVRVLVSGWTPRSDYVDDLRNLIATTEGAGFASGGGPPDEYVHLLFRAAA